MSTIIFKFFGFAALGLCIVYMAASAFRRSRRLDARIRAFRKEQDELARSGRSVDPYAGLAEIYAEKDRKPSEKERHDRRRD